MLVKEINEEWLREKNACVEGIAWFKSQTKTDPIDVLNALIDDKKTDWANWLITSVMDRPQYLAYAIFAAEQVIDIFESQYQYDKRPRQTIEAAKAVLENDTPAARAAARAAESDARAAGAAARAAESAAWAAESDAWAARAAGTAAGTAAESAARAAARAAGAAARAAESDAWAARAAGTAAESAARAAARAAGADMRLKILQYGISLLEKESICVR